jgi:tetratricopeptide (TPR) repeat protein
MSPPRPGADRRPLVLLLLALLVTAAAYARGLDGQLQFDDTEGIERNPALKDLGGYLENQFLAGFARAGRPVVDLTFALNYRLGRLEPRNFHLTNLAIHLCVVLLAWAFTRAVARRAGMASGEWVAAAVAAAFALHPLQSQAVSYVSQRAESLASAFYIMTVLLLLRAEGPGPRAARVAALMGALLAFGLGLGTKAIVLTAPVAYLFASWVLSGAPSAGTQPARWRTRLAMTVPFFAIGVAAAMTTLRSLSGHTDAGFDVPGVTAWQYLLTQAKVIVLYLRLLAWPSGQSVEWDVPVSTSLLEPAVLASAALLVSILAGAMVLACWSRRREGEGAAAARIVALGGLWFFLVLSVTSSVVPLADVMFEHRVYLASWGFFVAAAALAERATARWLADRAWVSVLALGLLLGGWAAALHQRNAVWETREALWRDAITKAPDRPRPYLSLGWAYRVAGRHQEAIAQYREGLARARREPEIELKLVGNLGAALIHQERYAEAAQILGQGLARAPERLELLVNMGIALGELGDEAGAEAHLWRAARQGPENAWVWNSLGVRRLVRQDYQGALPLLERARSLQPDFAEAHFNAAQALDKVGRRGEACRAWREGLSLGLGGYRNEAERLVRERCR